MGASASSLFGAIWNRLFGSDEYKIVMVGLDNAGKTTILYRLCAAARKDTVHPRTHNETPDMTQGMSLRGATLCAALAEAWP